MLLKQSRFKKSRVLTDLKKRLRVAGFKPRGSKPPMVSRDVLPVAEKQERSIRSRCYNILPRQPSLYTNPVNDWERKKEAG